MVFVKHIVRESGQIFAHMSEFERGGAAAAEPPEFESDHSRDMEDYLNSWGLGMYVDKFKEQSIDLDTLQILSADDIKELVPIIGHRARLTAQIAMLKDIVTDAFSGTDKELYKLLSSGNEGRGLLLQYQENDLLNNASRRRLCNIIISNELKDDPERSISVKDVSDFNLNL